MTRGCATTVAVLVVLAGGCGGSDEGSVESSDTASVERERADEQAGPADAPREPLHDGESETVAHEDGEHAEPAVAHEDAPIAEPFVPEPSAPWVPRRGSVLDAEAGHEGLVLRIGWPFPLRYRNLRYEGNNASMRGPRRGATGTYEATGESIASHWRELASGVRQIFVLRDALFSQQDHPIDHDPHALMMPPSWVTAAVDEVLAGRALRPMQVPSPDADQAWASAELETVFGSFPRSERLFEAAREPRSSASGDAQRRITNARASLRSLAEDTREMVDVGSQGAEAVARAGAARIAASDRRYFGDAIRRDRVIPIFVESPNEHEVEAEGKGLVPAGRAVDPRAVTMARRAIYRARLADGDMAIERYDISRAEERARIVRVLEELVPEGQPSEGGVVWVWVNGTGYDGHSRSGTDPLPHIPALRAELEMASVDVSRVSLLAKPSVELPREGDRRTALEAALGRHRALGIVTSVHLDSRSYAALVAREQSAR